MIKREPNPHGETRYKMVEVKRKTIPVKLWLSDDEYRFLYELGKAYNRSATEIAYMRAMGYELTRKE